jgi:hypothetical protein
MIGDEAPRHGHDPGDALRRRRHRERRWCRHHPDRPSNPQGGDRRAARGPRDLGAAEIERIGIRTATAESAEAASEIEARQGARSLPLVEALHARDARAPPRPSRAPSSNA